MNNSILLDPFSQVQGITICQVQVTAASSNKQSLPFICLFHKIIYQYTLSHPYHLGGATHKDHYHCGYGLGELALSNAKPALMGSNFALKGLWFMKYEVLFEHKVTDCFLFNINIVVFFSKMATTISYWPIHWYYYSLSWFISIHQCILVAKFINGVWPQLNRTKHRSNSKITTIIF